MKSSAFAAVLLAASLLHAPARADDGATREARALFAEGNQRIQEGDYARALSIFQRAYALFPSVKILLNIGTMLRQLGRNAEAADAYEAYLRDPAADPAKAPEVAALLAKLDAQVGKLRVEVFGGAATVRVDGKVVDKAPSARALVVRAEPGPHAVSVERDGAPPVRVDVQAVAGQETMVPVSLPAAADAPRPLPVQSVPPGPAAGTPAAPLRVAAATTTAVGAAGLVVGVSLALVARSRWNDLLAGCAVRSPSPAGCRPEDASLQSSAGQLADGATAAFVVGGAAVATATALWIAAARPARPASAWRLAPLVQVQARGFAAVLERRF